MDGGQKFWLGVWGIVGAVVMSLILSTCYYWTDHNTKIVELISKGADPVAVMCAMQDAAGNNPTCIILATKD